MIRFEDEKIAVIGLGYVGLPVALSFGRKLPTVGFDIRQQRVDQLLAGKDETAEVTASQLGAADKLELTADPARLADCTFYIVAVPTPIDRNNRPDLGPVISRVAHGRTAPPEGRRRRLRVDGLPRRHRGGLRSDPRRGLAASAAASTSTSATRPSASTRATRSTPSSAS